MLVRKYGRKRRVRVVWVSAAFLMVLGVMIFSTDPAYSFNKHSVACFSVITVEPGQDLNALAKRYATTTAQILKDNPQVPSLTPGITLTIRENTRNNEASRGAIGTWQWPVSGEVSSEYGRRGDHDFHHGLDIAVPSGTEVKAVRAGRVLKADWLGVYGLTVLIDHGNGIQSLYGHNHRLLVQAGDFVQGGETIALSGNTGNTTGPHLHFEIRVKGKTVDPAEYLLSPEERR